MVREREREKGGREQEGRGRKKKIDEKEGRKKKHAKLSTAPPRYFLALSKPSLQMLLATTTLHLPRALSSRSPSQHRCNIPFPPPPPLPSLTPGVERCRSKLDDPSSNVEETSYPVSFLSSPQLVLNEEKLAIGRSLSLQVTIRDSLLPLRSFKPLAPTFERVVSE